MSVVYLWAVDLVEQVSLDFISMEWSVYVLTMEAAVEMATILELWKIVKKDVAQSGQMKTMNQKR